MDEIARFLEFDSGVSTAVCFSKGEIYIALNKCSEKFPLFKEMCYDFFKFLKFYTENPFLKDEKELTFSFILQSYRYSRSPSVEDEKKLKHFYEQKNINSILNLNNDVLLIRCELLLRIKNLHAKSDTQLPTHIYIKKERISWCSNIAKREE